MVQSMQREVARIQRMMDGHHRLRAAARIRGMAGADVNVALRETLSFLTDQGCPAPHHDRRAARRRAALPVKATALELEQAFANLLLNAADAMPARRTLVWTNASATRSRWIAAAPTMNRGRSPRRADRALARSHEIAQVIKIVCRQRARRRARTRGADFRTVRHHEERRNMARGSASRSCAGS